jgi:APA family basic amino acid/polyamine antiporter
MSGHRSLGFWRTWSLVVGGAIGSAVFMMPAVLAPYGHLGTLGLAAATVGALTIALMLGHMARRVTATGGSYAHTRAAFGDLPAFLIGWGLWISFWVACATIALGFAAYAGTFVPAIAASPRLSAATALAVLWASVAVNNAGVRESGIVTLITSVLKILPILIVGLAGAWMVAPQWSTAPIVEGSPIGIFGSVFALAFWNFVGIEAGAVAAENVINPARTIPRALIAGTLTVGALYLLVNIAAFNALPLDILARSSAPLADVGRALLGEPGAVMIALGALISTAGCLNVSILETGQTAMAIARDGLFPSVFARLSSRHTPALSNTIAGGLASALLLLNFSDSLIGAWTFMSLLATVTIVIPYAASALASLALQRRDNDTSATQTSVAVIALITCTWIILSSGFAAVAWGVVLLAAGVPVYAGVRRKTSV